MQDGHVLGMTRTAFRSLPLIALLAALGGQAMANPYASYLDVQVLPGWKESDGDHVAGLELTLAEGWKTYWRVPGSAGIPPSFDWSGSSNLGDVRIVWPRPEVQDADGMRSIVYHDRVVLPLEVTPKNPGEPVVLNGRIFLGICENVCVPMEVSVNATLPVDAAARHTPPIASALAGRPFSAAEAKVTSARCKVRPDDGGLLVEARLAMPSAGGREVTVFETPMPGAIVSDSVTERQGDMLISRARISSSGQGVGLDRSQLKITVLGQNYAVEIDGCDAG